MNTPIGHNGKAAEYHAESVEPREIQSRPLESSSEELPIPERARYLVKVFVNRDHSLYLASYVYVGLWMLAARGAAFVQFLPAIGDGADRFLANIGHTCLEVQSLTTGQVRRVCIDVSDRSDLFSTDGLQWCNLYLKRSYYRPDVEHLENNLRRKLAAFGMVFGCRGKDGASQYLKATARQLSLRCLSIPTRGFSPIRETLDDIRAYLASPSVEEFECSPLQPLEMTVLFQTRVLSVGNSDDDAEIVNEQRVRVIRALKEAFGPRFVGGLMPTNLSIKRYPDVVTSHEFRRGAYIAMSKRSLIGVYTRGLHHSIAYKFPEYMAAGKCIVSDPIQNELPVPLIEGTNYLSYQTPVQCVEACQRLLANPELASDMRETNYRYYCQQVRPDVRMLRSLDMAFEKGC